MSAPAVDFEPFEGKAPKDSGLLCLEGTYYRRHFIPCPSCKEGSIGTPLTDEQAQAGVKLQCGVCRHRWTYSWSLQLRLAV